MPRAPGPGSATRVSPSASAAPQAGPGRPDRPAARRDPPVGPTVNPASAGLFVQLFKLHVADPSRPIPCSVRLGVPSGTLPPGPGPDIEVYVDIEDHDIDVFVDIEYSNLDIDVTVFDIRVVVTKKTSISTSGTSISGTEIEALRYCSVGTSISV